MSELRQDPTTRGWVIMATERRRRPHEFDKPLSSMEARKNMPLYMSDCPFCAGNEYLSTNEIRSYRTYGTYPNAKGWWVRVIPNKYAALSPDAGEAVPARLPEAQHFADYFYPRTANIFRSKPGIGSHEVIVDTPVHNENFPFFSDKQIQEVFLMYRDRYLDLHKNPRFKFIIIFKNYGANAGTSIYHSHSQIIATPVIPLALRNNISQALFYYDDIGRCIFCDMLQAEIADGRRIIFKTDDFIAFYPFASENQFETWIMPVKHESCFGLTSVDKTKALGILVKKILKGIYNALGDPDYNFMIYNPPVVDEKEEYYHWSFRIVPRLTMKAGFELGTGMSINTALPEETAEFMKDFIKD